MSQYQRTPYQQADAQRLAEDADDQDEEAMVNDYREQVHFNDGMSDLDRNLERKVHFNDGMSDLDRTTSMSALPDMQAQLLAAATPLEYPASLETKFQSYDNYCNLFHYILNSNGPVDIDAPSVRRRPKIERC